MSERQKKALEQVNNLLLDVRALADTLSKLPQGDSLSYVWKSPDEVPEKYVPLLVLVNGTNNGEEYEDVPACAVYTENGFEFLHLMELKGSTLKVTHYAYIPLYEGGTDGGVTPLGKSAENSLSYPYQKTVGIKDAGKEEIHL